MATTLSAAIWPADQGAIAQLGERVVRNDEVGGSIPPGSTILRSLRELRLGEPISTPSDAKRAKDVPLKPAGRKRTSAVLALIISKLTSIG